MKKAYLIEHCKKGIDKYKNIPELLYVYLENKILLDLLLGKDVNEMFDNNDEYINNESII